MRGTVFAEHVNMVVETCCNCGMHFAMTEEFRKRALAKPGENGVVFYCPAGHRQWYVGESKETKLRRENERLRQNQSYLEDMRQRAEDEARHQRQRAAGYKGQAAKVSKRAKAGTCPCCNRTFANMARHMASQHPEFSASKEISK